MCLRAQKNLQKKTLEKIERLWNKNSINFNFILRTTAKKKMTLYRQPNTGRFPRNIKKNVWNSFYFREIGQNHCKNRLYTRFGSSFRLKCFPSSLFLLFSSISCLYACIRLRIFHSFWVSLCALFTVLSFNLSIDSIVCERVSKLMWINKFVRCNFDRQCLWTLLFLLLLLYFHRLKSLNQHQCIRYQFNQSRTSHFIQSNSHRPMPIECVQCTLNTSLIYKRTMQTKETSVSEFLYYRDSFNWIKIAKKVSRIQMSQREEKMRREEEDGWEYFVEFLLCWFCNWFPFFHLSKWVWVYC